MEIRALDTLVHPKVLKDRLDELGYNMFDLARIVAERRNRSSSDNWTAKRLYSTVRQALNNPDGTSTRILEEIITALDGEMLVRWAPKVIATERLVNSTGDLVTGE